MDAETCLIVDDDELLRTHLGRAIEARGFRVTTAESGEQALQLVEEECPDRAIIDLRMPGMGGLELLERLREKCPTIRVVVLTGFGSIANAVAAVRAGAVNYVTKPAHASEVLAAFTATPEVEVKEESEDIEAPSLAEAEWNHIQRVLDECDGNVSRAARLLDIPRRTLQRKLKKRAP
ncbi:Photosynthetic apparatus regulatory protein RegA [Maioricimonas rarisocia]|uniref:Photosynthetic apparatus regulatory protein RegA n=1 Tax=Maioricimonas rarisocia TaxID=2528026 RepID=A0A517ZFF7_9PLAN|nr:response regulator [Maioricimonas rarisocia]QDU41169.1 Photosynthetic apparatus regulatory protein RegA [Maioricimonas rarisocia]